MPYYLTVPEESEGWQTVEHQHLVHQVRPKDGARRSQVEVRDGAGRLVGRWAVPPQVGKAARPPLQWD